MERFRKLFAISEIPESKILQIVSGAFLISFLATFSGWVSTGFTSKYANILCSPHITDCTLYKSIIALTPLPYGYSQTTFYVFLFALISLGFYYIYVKEFELLWITIAILWLYKMYIIYGFGAGNYDYYDIILIAVFLFSKNKLYWLRIFFLILYFLASTIKIHEGWILGTYFTSLQTGLPIFGNYVAPIATNIVIISQMVFSWFLFRPKASILFNLAFFYFLFFHLYSGILVEYRYMITSIPLLVILFWLPDEIHYKKNKDFFAIFFFITLLCLQSIAILIPGDQKLTLEGNNYGLYMFEANHQCMATYTTNYTDGRVVNENKQTSDARNRCDPYTYVYGYKNRCGLVGVKSISFTFDHSINGNPFYRIVDAPNLCTLTYKPFTHNPWIKSGEDNPQMIGRPVKDFYMVNVSSVGTTTYTKDGLVILPGLERNSAPTLNPIQKFLYPHLSIIRFMYWTLWTLEFFAIIYYFFIKKRNI